jgi:uncharacterized protein with FMN-binding domain
MINRPHLRTVAAIGLAVSSALGMPACSNDSYRDGTYAADGWYGGQPSRIGVRLTLAEGAITSVAITSYATDPTSLGFQRDFAEAVPDQVRGRPIDEADVDRLAGASGTSEGWNAALASIREQASR